MVGLIHKLLFDLVEGAAGSGAVAEVKRRAEVSPEKEFRMNEVYADDEWRRLLEAAFAVLEVTPEQGESAFAEVFLKDALKRWPTWFQQATSARQFLELQPIIHNGFATSVQDSADRAAITDKFNLIPSDDKLVMHYRSPNRLCGLYVKLARGIIDHYGDHASVEHVRCQKDGAPECEIHVRWASQGKG